MSQNPLIIEEEPYLKHDAPEGVNITFISEERVILKELRGTPSNSPTDRG